MRTITEIILTTGGWDRLQQRPLKVEAVGFMPLCLEITGTGPRGGLLLSIAHYYEQNGDLMCDPDLVVEVFPQLNRWSPVSYQQDSIGLFEEAVVQLGDGLVIRSKLVDDLTIFLEQWDKNLREQGFIEAAMALAAVGG